jgi:hypothetical protein
LTETIIETDERPGVELELAGAPPSLFGTSDPRIALERMSELADALVDVVRQKKLSTRIQGRDHLAVEAWQTLGGLVGVFAAIIWTRPNESGDGYVARAEARTLRGELVGAAEAECSRAEKVWSDRYPYTLRSMAQTRAISRALRAPLAQIAVLAGYEATAAEEMPVVDVTRTEPEPNPVATHPRSAADPVAVTDEQAAEIETLVRSLEACDADTDWRAWCREQAGPWRELTEGGAAILIRRLRERLAEHASSEGGQP